jgi:hypothetical protein
MVGCIGSSQPVRVGSVSWFAPAVRFGKDQFVACGSVQFHGNFQTPSTPPRLPRLIDFFNSLADASITKKPLREIEQLSHDLYVTRASTILSSHGIRYSPMLSNEVLAPSHAETKIQGDLKASVAALQTQLESRVQGGSFDFRTPAKRERRLKARSRVTFAEWQRERDRLILEQGALNVQAASERRSLVFLLGQLQSR